METKAQTKRVLITPDDLYAKLCAIPRADFPARVKSYGEGKDYTIELDGTAYVQVESTGGRL